MSALPLRRLWWRIEDRMPPRKQWPAWAASMALLAVIAVIVLWPDYDSPQAWRNLFIAIAILTILSAAILAADYFGNKRWPE